VINIINEWLKANNGLLPFQGTLFDSSDQEQTVGNIVRKLESLRLKTRPDSRTIFLSLREVQPKIIEALASHVSPDVICELERPRLISDAIFEMREYFDTYVRYLGPLRDEPKPFYPLEALANPTDVGYRGEHTAAVLDLNKSRAVTYVPSTNFFDFANESVIDTPLKRASLQEAVVDWLSYMAVVEDVSTGEGKIGHELQVKIPGINKYHDLTNVGVGVSQVLPIVLMALVAPPGSFLIFEQPELHLHPKVQTRLADFFISIALAGKQCLLGLIVSISFIDSGDVSLRRRGKN
jgi:hypothetical protein